MRNILLHCRPGFEAEVCAEIAEKASNLGIAGFARAKTGNAYAEYQCTTSEEARRLIQETSFASNIFSRQWSCGQWMDLPEKNRIAPLIDSLVSIQQSYGSLWLEVLDTNDGKEVSGFCRKFEKPFQKALLDAGILKEQKSLPRLILTFINGCRVFVGYAFPNNSALWPMGIPRLKFPKQAPSRSTLKLEEAWHSFIPRSEWDKRLAPGMTAVDLGASPGGWTWQLVNRHIQVTAVDNGPMNAELMDSGLVVHQRQDGFAFKPRKPVDWMVCDIVEKPARNAALLEHWIAEAWCREAIVNLKLPMKQRYAEVHKLLERIKDSLKSQGIAFELTCKQLYHDREEVSCHIRRLR